MSADDSSPSLLRLAFVRLLWAIWLGGGVFLITVAAPAAFRVASSPTVAGDFVGAMLTRWHYLALFIPLVMLILEWRLSRSKVLLVLFFAVVLAAMQAIVDVQIRSIREHSVIAINALDRTHPLRRHFGRLHGLSSLFLLGQILAGVSLVFVDRQLTRRRDALIQPTEPAAVLASTVEAQPSISAEASDVIDSNVT